MKFNILIKAKHIPGKHNVLADHLSRFKFPEAKKFAPWLYPQPTTVSQTCTFSRLLCLLLPSRCTYEVIPCYISSVLFKMYLSFSPLQRYSFWNFIGELFQQGYSPSTITSHVSAISYLHKLFTFPTQHTPLLSEKLSKVLTTWQNLGTLDFQSLNLFLSNYYLPFIIQFKRQIQECFCPQFSSLPFMPLCGWVN